MGFFEGTQERVRNNRGRRPISVLAILLLDSLARKNLPRRFLFIFFLLLVPLLFYFHIWCFWQEGCSGSAMVLGKLPVPGHPTNLN